MITHRRRHPLHRFVRQNFYRIYNVLKKLYWRVCKPKTHGVKVMMFNSKSEILLARIGYMHKLWVIPGGKVEKRETPEVAAKREVYEEIGIELEKVSLTFTVHHEKQGAKATVDYFEAITNINDFCIDDEEIVDVGWFSLTTLPEQRVARVDEAILQYNSWNAQQKMTLVRGES